MSIIKTANTHQTSLIVSEQIPEFVRADHPVFVEFLETYYEFLSQANTGILTTDGASFYMGAEYATKIIPDIMDIDATDFTIFVDSFRKQYGPHIPKQLFENANIKLLYKNLIEFYNAKGSEDSIKCLFRILYGEEVSIRYPEHDVLIASGGEVNHYVKILVSVVGNIEVVRNQKITGSVSGTSAFVDNIVYHSSAEENLEFVPGHKSSVSGQSIEGVYSEDRLLGVSSEYAMLFLDLTSITGKFAVFETLTVEGLDDFEAIVFPFAGKTKMYDGFSQHHSSNTSIFSEHDNLLDNSSLPVNPPWDTLHETVYTKVFNKYDPPSWQFLTANATHTSAESNVVFTSTGVRIQADTSPLGSVAPWPVMRIHTDDDPVFNEFKGKDFTKVEVNFTPKVISTPTNSWYGKLSWTSDGNPPHDRTEFDSDTLTSGPRVVFIAETQTANVYDTAAEIEDFVIGSANTQIWDLSNINGVANTPQSEAWANSVITGLELSLFYPAGAADLIDHEIHSIKIHSGIQSNPLVNSDLFSRSWYSVGGQGDVRVVPAYDSATGRVLQIGNNSTTTGASDGDMRWFVGTKDIKINSDKIYKMSIRMRHLGGNTYDSVTGAGSANTLTFWAGFAAVDDTKSNPIDYYGEERGVQLTPELKWKNANYFVLGGVTEVDENWFTYDGYISGIASWTDAVGTTGGTGGRNYSSVASGFSEVGQGGGTSPGYNSYIRAANGQSTFPRGSEFFRPVFIVNSRHPGAGDAHPYSQGITQIDYVTVTETETSFFDQEYISEKSLLSSPQALIQDGWYSTKYAYEISSLHSMSEYEGPLDKLVHPAGMKLFGAKVHEGYVYKSEWVIPDQNVTVDDISPSGNEANNFISPAWSRDGTNLAYTKYAGSTGIGAGGIHTSTALGAGEVEHTRDSLHGHPRWNPDGTKLVYDGYDGTYWQIYTLDVASSVQTQLTFGEYNSRFPDWSPDDSIINGGIIIFVAPLKGGPMPEGWTGHLHPAEYSGIYWTFGDGTPAHESSNSFISTMMTSQPGPPRYSPDAKSVVFSHMSKASNFNDNQYEIYKVSVGAGIPGSSITRLTHNEGAVTTGQNPVDIPGVLPPAYEYWGDNSDPSWSSDGNYIIFTTSRKPWRDPAYINQLFIMRSDGSGQEPVLFDLEGLSPVAQIFGSDWSVNNKIIYAGKGPSDTYTTLNAFTILEKNKYISASGDTFSPDSLDSLAGWWKADSIGPTNVQVRKWSDKVVANGSFGTNTNRLPMGMSGFDEMDVDYVNLQHGSSTTSLSVDYSAYTAPPISSSRSLKIINDHTSQVPHIFLNKQSTKGHPYQENLAYEDFVYNIILDPNKKWLFSTYALTSNLVSDTTYTSFQVRIQAANSTGFSHNISPTTVEDFSEVNTWERKSVILDMSAHGETKATLRFDFPDRRSGVNHVDVQATTGNTFYLFDGLMLEEYDPAIHGVYGTSRVDSVGNPYVPSPYILPGINGANVLSWYDTSINRNHAYANTSMVFGSQWYPPQYVANTGTGHPAIRFRSNNAYQGASAAPGHGNVYAYSSFPTYTPTLMTGLQGKTSPAANTLYRPISNTFTGFVVARTNLVANDINYDSNGVWPHESLTLFETGAVDTATTGMSHGTFGLRLDPNSTGNGMLTTVVANSVGTRTTVYDSIEGDATTHLPLDTSTGFRIFGISEGARKKGNFRSDFTDGTTGGITIKSGGTQSIVDSALHVSPSGTDTIHEIILGAHDPIFTLAEHNTVTIRLKVTASVDVNANWIGRLMWENEDGGISNGSTRVAWITESGTIPGSGGTDLSDTDYWVSIGSPDDEYVYVSWDLSKISSWTHKNIRSIEFQLWDANPGNYVIDSVINHDKNENLLSLNYNGRHKGIANLQFETHWSQSTGNASPYDLSADGLNYQTQLNTNGTFTIGYARTGDYTSGDRAFSWFDGDIAEILWFDEQLSIKNIALVEGYLAHKYGIQDDLIHKDGVGDHPYKYQRPPAIGANNEVY